MKKWIILGVVLGLVFTGSLSAQQEKTVKENGLVGYWNFDEGKGEVAKDSSGNDIYGEIIGAEWVKGIKGSALEFNGEDAYVDCGSDDILNIADAITIECWVKRTGDGVKWNGIVSKGAGSKGYQTFHYNPSNNFTIYLNTNATGYGSVMGQVIPLNEWMHLVVTYDSKEKMVKLYQNGVMTASKQYEGQITDFAENFYIGRTTGFNYFCGLIDEVRVYNRALTEAEIQEHYKVMGGKKEIVSSTPGRNLVNPSFEEDKNKDGIPDGWHIWGGSLADKTAVTISQEKAHHGKYSIKIEDNNEKQSVGLESDLINITPGNMYKFSAYAFVLEGGPSIYLQFFDFENKRIEEAVKISSVGIRRNTWVTVEAYGKAPDNAMGCKLLFYSSSVNEDTAYFDEAKLEDLGKEYKVSTRAVVISDKDFFSLLNLDFSGMEEVKEAVKRGDLEKAKSAYLDFRRNKIKFKWFINPSDKPTKPVASSHPAGDKLLKHIFPPMAGEPEIYLGEDIDWETNPIPSSDQNRAYLWSEILNSLNFWNTLGQAYWQTLDEKYAREWVLQMEDWVKDLFYSGTSSGLASLRSRYFISSIWSSLHVGMRITDVFCNVYSYFLFSPSFTPDAHCTFAKSIWDHASRIIQVCEQKPKPNHNYDYPPPPALLVISILFPEYNAAKEWQEYAVKRIISVLDATVYPDGAEYELAPTYHNMCCNLIMKGIKIAKMNDISLPKEIMDKLKKMYVYNLYMMDPSGNCPPFNDSGRGSVKTLLKDAYEIWGDEEFLFCATSGKEGKKPKEDSYFFNYAGYYVMRSGWDSRKDNCLYFDAGPFGFSHQHEDMLNLYLYSGGKILLTEVGSYMYDYSKWRKYCLSSYGHNTIIVDGKEQNRMNAPSTYTTEQPLDNPSIISPFFDYAAGTYSEGYQKALPTLSKSAFRVEFEGDKDSSVSHNRNVIFLKPYYYLVIDFLEGEGSHTYDVLFHLDAREAEMDEKTKAVFSLSSGRKQLGLFPFDTKNLELKIVKGQEEPVLLGWLPSYNRKKPIPTIVYSKTEEPPSCFSTFLFPYSGTKPEVRFKEIMKYKKDVWARTVFTPYETISLILRKKEGKGMINIEEEISSLFSTNARLIVIRKPKDANENCFGFYNFTEYKENNLNFKSTAAVSLLMIKKENKIFMYNPLEKEINLNFVLPFNKTLTLPAKIWVEATSGEAKKIEESISPFKKADLDSDVSSVGEIDLANYPIFESSGQENKTVEASGVSALFYRGRAPANRDYLTFEIPISKEGDYEVLGTFLKHFCYGIVQLSVDGKKIGEPYDGYDKETYDTEVNFGKIHLTSGKHYFRYDIIGKNPLSDNYYIGIVSLTLR
ncbi:hypothetical protein COY51_06770 [Candidatus Desantisbacteria bacterium CG_4_10_14_0_8_um_filter_39_17]|uniref:LamG-like jellyroll fold domain-containing protein n=1 Tax=Candidatus Desantisbacteria bacterium CG_4_10_14_0_8_um_filter_39_17 TaxID=1974542 RepID=A0A2H9P9L3_9BACT|nr:MAG: hypothetical protein COY51_06770 [Candidatus Desantisbacteria bacterium CG_4_10_14_0_8_um_filter_39_17]